MMEAYVVALAAGKENRYGGIGMLGVAKRI